MVVVFVVVGDVFLLLMVVMGRCLFLLMVDVSVVDVAWWLMMVVRYFNGDDGVKRQLWKR